mmetsp:Transcript_11902/g.39156  ORF Transcript_11902/g.39156 Transcript_11902/m.39156 type:complete len:257 (+) Transcript_11902:285-1055(+)|eukprot:CAMPEP_0170135258 /NCGR_PEP_ID=MMETSP0033_2-20121228/2388_1 /TAXON_ID=195969 /ORGANISM="Dolichomastix tenuilepis, Strain CCMP3274" /LENGTH=256 /DNA_ID=CAMNT_0010370857 /DNA_START=356 /DNA_END=1126 /DNA_ORIENTATION=-
MTDLANILINARLESKLSVLKEFGVESITDIHEVTDDDLTSLGFNKLEKNRLRTAVANVKTSQFPSEQPQIVQPVQNASTVVQHAPTIHPHAPVMISPPAPPPASMTPVQHPLPNAPVSIIQAVPTTGFQGVFVAQQERWSTTISDVCAEPGGCGLAAKGYFCFPCLYGEIAQEVGYGDCCGTGCGFGFKYAFSCTPHCILCCMAPAAQDVINLRQATARKYNIQETPMNCFAAWGCGLCVLCMLQREVAIRKGKQ